MESIPSGNTGGRAGAALGALGALGGELLDELTRRYPDSECTYATTIPARPARLADWPDWVHPPLREHLTLDRGIHRLFSHQREAADLAWEGHHVVVATGTSSGKSLAYQLPILSRLAADPTACALYLTPTKALGSDQLTSLLDLTAQVDGLGSIAPAPYDGDTPMAARAGIRDASRLIVSTPDMVHSSLLANHERWGRLLRRLAFVVVDECHVYRGVFGANVALVLRRLRRLAARYGAEPTFVLASATTAEPAAHAARLLGTDNVDNVDEVTAVDVDGAPTGERTVLLWEPGFIEGATGEQGAPVRRAATTEAAGIMATAIAHGARTLTFVRSRRSAETVALRAQEELGSLGRPDFARRVASYRAGYLAEDRHRLERALDDGTLLGVATTSALELGIDVGELDAVVTAGFPGTVASLWQQAGRAGRRGQGSVVVLVARDEPMDTYLVHHPEALLGRPIERIVFDPHNPYVLRAHLLCAAAELPLTDAEITALHADDVAAALAAEGLLRRRPAGWFAAPEVIDTAHAHTRLRGSSGEEVMIVDATDGRLLGTIDSARAPAQVHPGAVYLHQGESFVIEELDFANYLALARPERPDYTTFARSVTDIRVTAQPDEAHLRNPSPGLWVASVDVEVTTQVTGFLVKLADGSTADLVPLDMPPQVLATRAVAYTIDPAALTAMGIAPGDVPGALHAAEHAAIGMLPLIATCDRWDIGGVSTAMHPDTELPTVFVYDGQPGGAGFADCGFERFAQWIRATFEAVRACECESGCPSCVQSPKCGNGNQPLDKAAALKLLGALVTMLPADD